MHSPDSTGSTSKPCVLVVDDDDGMRKLLEVALTRHGFRVRVTADGREAVQLYEQHKDDIDAVVLDVRMPVCDGPKALADLQRVNPNVRAVFVTGFPGDHDVDGLLARGAAGVFQKPFSLLELVEFLRKLITPD
jgi:two-component system OmpR family response regulator